MARDEPEPTGECAHCLEPIEDHWDTSGNLAHEWFCSRKCLFKSWLDWQEVPLTFWTFDPQRPSCGPDRIRIAEEWLHAPHGSDQEDQPPGLLLHSVRSGTGKTRVATHLACLAMLRRWKGHAMRQYCECYQIYPRLGLWLNARRFRQRYQETMHFAKAAERVGWLEVVSQCGLLVLDEPDKLKPSEGLVETLYGILDERFSNYRLTIITTNARGRELERRWGDEYGPYLVRRLREFCLAIDFDP